MNDVSQQTFLYIANLNSDAQSQIEHVSLLAHGTSDDLSQLSLTVTDISNTANYAANTVHNLSNTVYYSVNLKGHSAYDNKLALSKIVKNVSTNYWATRQKLNDYITSMNKTTSSLSSSIQTNKDFIKNINSCLSNVSLNYWKTNNSLLTITTSHTTTVTWLGNVSLCVPYMLFHHVWLLLVVTFGQQNKLLMPLVRV